MFNLFFSEREYLDYTKHIDLESCDSYTMHWLSNSSAKLWSCKQFTCICRNYRLCEFLFILKITSHATLTYLSKSKQISTHLIDRQAFNTHTRLYQCTFEQYFPNFYGIKNCPLYLKKNS